MVRILKKLPQKLERTITPADDAGRTSGTREGGFADELDVSTNASPPKVVVRTRVL